MRSRAEEVSGIDEIELRLAGAEVEASWLRDWAPRPLAEVFASAAPPPAGGIVGVTDDEVDEFLALIRE